MRKYLKYLPILLLIPFLLAVSLRVTNDGGGVGISVQNTRSASLTFDGVDDVVEVSHDSNYNFGTGDFSITAWVNPKTLSGRYIGLVTKRVPGNTAYWQFCLDDSASGNYRIIFYGADNGSIFDVRGDTIISSPPSIWYHIAVTIARSETTGKIYLNGIEDKSVTVSGTADWDNSTIIRFGFEDAGNGILDGQPADVRIFNRALSPAEITRVYRGEIITDGLVGHWPLQEGGLSEKAYDVSGNDNHGDLTNFTLSDGWANVQNVNHYNQQMGHSTEILGSNLITNGGFDTADNWVVSSPWQISGGVASIDGSQTSTKLLYQLNVTEIGNLYKIVYTITSYTAGQVFVSLGTSDGIYRSATGTYTDYLIATINTVFYFNADSDFNGAVDDVFVKEITNDVPAGAKVPALADGSGIDAIGNAINNAGRGYNKSLLNVTN